MQNDRLTWPILLLLLTALVPSLGVVWMMREAVRNEKLATSQRLRDAYQTQLESAKRVVQNRWSALLETLTQLGDEHNSAYTFAEIVSQNIFDSVFVYDQQGQLVYPNLPVLQETSLTEFQSEWALAEKLEFTDQKHGVAAEMYSQIVQKASKSGMRACARQAQARCVLKQGDKETAIKILKTQSGLTGVFDERGRSFAAAAELRLLELLAPETQHWKEVTNQLARRLNDYKNETLPSTQRLFLMRELHRLSSDSIELPTQTAELLAAEMLSVKSSSTSQPHMLQMSIPGIWSHVSIDGRVRGFFRTVTLRNQLTTFTEEVALPNGVAFTVVSPDETVQNLMETSLGKGLGRWRLALTATAGNPFNDTSQQRKTVHVWVALLVVAVTCTLVWQLSTALRRRMRLAQLKNDLVATVSHELKTPLASIRLLVDTLLEADDKPAASNSPFQVREYLELISVENLRLTRLIERFLTFSRLDRSMQNYDFQVVDLHRMIDKSVSVFREHYDAGDCGLSISVEKHARVYGDFDSLVTVVVNLLENAWKYSNKENQIALTVNLDKGKIAIEVSDNGIGLSSRAASRVFDRFYQVDQRVSRIQGGCGLGLSIVQAIIRAHRGEIRVKSKLGVGSTFTIWLPVHDMERPDSGRSILKAGNQ